MTALRLIVAVILGLVLGSLVNMALIMLGGLLIAPPPGADLSTAEGLRAAAPQLAPRHFLFPFLAHALGTLAGAFIAAKLAVRRKPLAALLVGGLFFIGGILAASMIPAPAWFIALDLILAYFPCAWLGYWLARARRSTP
ncbi:MAG: hypothetical protein WCZ65_06040 [Lysobacteraceae bacterium]